jgi:phytoene dehydrogenase-like protein
VSEPQRGTAAVIGSGPNGLSAAILLARAGYRVTVYEANDQIGGGARSAELTLPGFVHDVCSAVHPMAVASPCFEQFPLAAHGLQWIQPDAPLAHPLDDGTAVMLERSLDATAANLGADGDAWRSFFGPLIEAWPDMKLDLLSPLLHIPKRPLRMAKFGMHALRPAASLARSLFREPRARALFAGIAAHSIMPLEAPASASFGIVLATLGHAVGWPIPRGGSQKISDALAGCLRAEGGEIVTGTRITRFPEADLIFCDFGPRQMLNIVNVQWPADFREKLTNWRYGPGAFKLDYALDGPIPWRAPECARAGTVHLGGTLEEVQLWERSHTGQPFVLLAQQSLFDATRAPAGKHTAWAYCHVRNGSTQDMTRQIEEQIERFAPGFRDRILQRSVLAPMDLERRNANLVGGDVNGGAFDLRQLLFRPTSRLYRTPLPQVLFCSASTPPGGGVHGMCGYNAVRAALGRAGRDAIVHREPG